jgi:hypothetical protein
MCVVSIWLMGSPFDPHYFANPASNATNQTLAAAIYSELR